MIKIIAVLYSLSSPTNCYEQTDTTSDFADVSMQSCLMGAAPLACEVQRRSVFTRPRSVSDMAGLHG